MPVYNDSRDDILGIIALTIITSFADPSVKIAIVLLKILAFFVFSIIIGILFYKTYQYWMVHSDKHATGM